MDEKQEQLKKFNIWLSDCIDYRGFVPLDRSPEIRIAIDRIAEIIGNMTIHLMKNSERGDIRIKNELSRKIDIEPYSKMTRTNWVIFLVKNLLLYGNALLVPKFTSKKDGHFIKDLVPIANGDYTINQDEESYTIFSMKKTYKNSDVLHFIFNPSLSNPLIGEGLKISLKDIVESLTVQKDTKIDFLKNRMIPSLIVSVDAYSEDLESDVGRDKIVNKYLRSKENGEPWVIPSGLVSVDKISPLSLKDVAINENLSLDLKLLSSIMGIPAYFFGVGEFNEKEHNNFIRTKILSLCKIIEQELSKKLLISKELYFKFNPRSLYSYSFVELAGVGSNLYNSGIITGNEVRDLLGFSPVEGLDELILLENYIKLDDISRQGKLKNDVEEKNV